MNKALRQKKTELYRKSKALRELASATDNYKIAKKIRKEQQDAYKQWEFVKYLSEVMEKMEKGGRKI